MLGSLSNSDVLVLCVTLMHLVKVCAILPFISAKSTMVSESWELYQWSWNSNQWEIQVLTFSYTVAIDILVIFITCTFVWSFNICAVVRARAKIKTLVYFWKRRKTDIRPFAECCFPAFFFSHLHLDFWPHHHNSPHIMWKKMLHSWPRVPQFIASVSLFHFTE